MKTILRKIRLCLATYRQARYAITRQFDPKAISRIQNTRLQNLIQYSSQNVKYYRELFAQAGINPDQIKTANDLAQIPVLTRATLRDRFWDLLPNEIPRSRVARTSGSTGMPVCILSDDHSRMYNSAAVIRFRQAVGMGFAFRPILTPLKTPNDPIWKPPHWTFLQGLHKTHYINPYIHNDKSTSFAIRVAKHLKEPALIGITPAIRSLAFNIRDGLFPKFKPCVVMTVGQTLTPEDRAFLEETFETKVTDDYACSEIGNIAWQCLQGTGYHINADNVIVEILKDGLPAREGQVGEVVLTSLNRRAMPIIRYSNGDLARVGQAHCPCGCKLPMIAEILGRTGQDITLPNGKKVPWNQLKGLMNHPLVRQFQLIQNAKGHMIIKYVPQPDTQTESLEKLLKFRFYSILGSSIPIITKQVSHIPPSTSGKMKLVISEYQPQTKPKKMP